MGITDGDSMRPKLVQLARDLFAFLIAEKGFARGRTEQNWWGTTCYYKYKAKQIGLGVNLDFRDDTVDFYLVRLQDGRVPKYGGVGFADDGAPMRQVIPPFLRDHLHMQDDRLDTMFALYKTPKPRSYQFYAELLRAGRDVVDSYIDLLLQQPLDVLFPLPGRRRRSAPADDR